jgi:hypothetical protein
MEIIMKAKSTIICGTLIVLLKTQNRISTLNTRIRITYEKHNNVRH